MRLRTYAAVIWRRKWLMVLAAVLATAAALAMSLAQDKRYRAASEVLVVDPAPGTAAFALEPERALQNELRRAQSTEIQRQVREVVGNEPNISARLAAGSEADVLLFEAESSDPELAADTANVYAQVYIDERRDVLTQHLRARIDVLEARLDAIAVDLDDASDGARLDLLSQQDRYESAVEELVTLVGLTEQSGATVIEAAVVPSSSIDPDLWRAGLLALAVGLLIGLGAAFLLDGLDDSLRNWDDLAKATGLLVLTAIPRVKDWKPGDVHVITREQPDSPSAEAYRYLRAAVLFREAKRGMKVVQFTSPGPDEGTTTTSANLAVACARAGQRVAVVDCHLRGPRIHEFFGLPNDKGFTTAMVGDTFHDVAQQVDSEPNLLVISAGPIPSDPSELLTSRTAGAFIQALRDEVDLVVVDSPPVLTVADPLVISQAVDGVILVTSAAHTEQRDATVAADRLSQVDAPLIGAVLNAYGVEAGSAHDQRWSYGRVEQVTS